MKIKETILALPAEAPVEVKDAWDEAFDLAKGISDIFHASAQTDEGLCQEAFRALTVVGDRLEACMDTVNDFLRPWFEEKGGAA